VKKYSDIVKMLMPTKKIWRGLKNATYLSFGNLLGLFINFFGFIYIARSLGPSDYGIYSTLGAFVGLFSILTFTGFTKVVLREGSKDLHQMGNFIEKIMGIKILFTFIAINVCIISSLFMPYSTQEKIYIIVISATLIYHSFYGFFGSVFQAAEKMQYNSLLKVLDRTLFVSISIFILYLGYGLPGLLGVLLFSHSLILIFEYILTKRFVRFKLVNKIKWNKLLLKPALIFSVLGFTTLLTTQIDLVMISWLGSSRDVGIYAVAFQITQVAVVLRGIVSTAFFPIFVKSFHNKLVNFKLLLKYSFLLSSIILLPAVMVSLSAEHFLTLVFGLEYVESSVILSVLIFYVAFIFFTLPFTNILQATHNEHILFKISWIGPIINITMNYLLFNEFGLIGIAYATFVVAIINLPIIVFLTWKAMRKHNQIILNKI